MLEHIHRVKILPNTFHFIYNVLYHDNDTKFRNMRMTYKDVMTEPSLRWLKLRLLHNLTILKDVLKYEPAADDSLFDDIDVISAKANLSDYIDYLEQKRLQKQLVDTERRQLRDIESLEYTMLTKDEVKEYLKPYGYAWCKQVDTKGNGIIDLILWDRGSTRKRRSDKVIRMKVFTTYTDNGYGLKQYQYSKESIDQALEENGLK